MIQNNLNDISQKLNNIYTKFENDTPPNDVFTNSHERSYNQGFYDGRLHAMECVVRELLGQSGEDLKNIKIQNQK